MWKAGWLRCALPFEDIGFATIDHHRSLRWGFPEVIFCAGETEEQVAGMQSDWLRTARGCWGLTPAKRTSRRLTRVPDLQYHRLARCLYLDREPMRGRTAWSLSLPVRARCAVKTALTPWN